jgi:hypothetical protein
MAAGIGVAAVAGLAAWGWSLRPERSGAWIWMATFLPVLWGTVELMQHRGEEPSRGRAIMTLHRTVIAWTAVVILLRVAPRLAAGAGLIDATWTRTGARLAGIAAGVGFMVFGNFLPKFPSPWTLGSEPFDWQRVHRFAGVVFLAGGAAATAAWLLLPVPQAARYGTAAIVTAAALGVGRKLISLARHARPNPSRAR